MFQLVGFKDEVLDVVFLGPGNSHVAVATNSIDIKLYSMKDMDCQLLQGHTDLVLTLSSTPSNTSLLLSGSKVSYVKSQSNVKKQTTRKGKYQSTNNTN